MADLNQPLLTLVGDILDPAVADLQALDTAQIHFERRVGPGSSLPERDVALSLLWLAGTRVQLHKLRGARHTLTHMRTRFRGRYKDLERVADFLEVRILFEEGENRQASEMLDKLQVNSEDPRVRKRLQSFRHYMRGELLAAIGQETVANDEFQRALDALKGEAAQRVDLALTAEIYNGQGAALTKMGELERALASYGRGATVAEHIGFQLSLARAQRGRGTLYSRMGELDRATEFLKDSLRLCQETRSPYGIIRACISLGRAHYAAREYSQALVYFEEARVQCGEGRYPTEEAEVASRIGDILVTEGRYSQAAEFYDLDLQLATAAGNQKSRAHALKNVGRIQRLLTNYDRAEVSLEEARALFSRMNDAEGLSTTLLQLVLSFVEQGKATQAREALETMKDAAERSGRPLERGLARMLEGMVLRREGRTEEATEHLHVSLKVLSETPGFYTVLCTMELGLVSEESDSLETSVHYYGEAVQLARKLRLHDMEKRALDLLARVDRAEWARLLHHQGPASPEQSAVSHVYLSIIMFELRGTGALMGRSSEDVTRIVDGFFDYANRAVVDYGGVLSKLMGTRVMGVFGLGGGCDPVEALRCGRVVLEALNGLLAEAAPGGGMGVAVSIATGEAMAGMLGPIDRREHTVLGVPVELAFDLMSAASSGEILVCPATNQAVGAQVAHPIPREIPMVEGRRIVAYVAATPALTRRQ